jgi:hypothetical protein
MTRQVSYCFSYLLVLVSVADSALLRLSFPDISARLYDAWVDASSSDELMSIAETFLNDADVVEVLEKSVHSVVNVTELQISAEVPLQRFTDVLTTSSVASESLRHVEQVLLSRELHDKILGNQSSPRLEQVLHRLSGEIEPIHGMIANLLQRCHRTSEPIAVKYILFSPRVVFKIKNIANAPVWLLLRFTYQPFQNFKMKYLDPAFQARYVVGSLTRGQDVKPAHWENDCKEDRVCYRYVYLDRKYSRSPNMYDHASLGQAVSSDAPDGGDCLTGGPHCYYALNHMPLFRDLGMGILMTTKGKPAGSPSPDHYEIGDADKQIVVQLWALSQVFAIPKDFQFPASVNCVSAHGRVITLTPDAGLGKPAWVFRVTAKHHRFLTWSYFHGSGFAGLEMQYNFPKMHKVLPNAKATADKEAADKIKNRSSKELNLEAKAYINIDEDDGNEQNLKCVIDPIKPHTGVCPRVCAFCLVAAVTHDASDKELILDVDDTMVVFDRNYMRNTERPEVCDVTEEGSKRTVGKGITLLNGTKFTFNPGDETKYDLTGKSTSGKFSDLPLDEVSPEPKIDGSELVMKCFCHYILDHTSTCTDDASIQTYWEKTHKHELKAKPKAPAATDEVTTKEDPAIQNVDQKKTDQENQLVDRQMKDQSDTQQQQETDKQLEKNQADDIEKQKETQKELDAKEKDDYSMKMNSEQQEDVLTFRCKEDNTKKDNAIQEKCKNLHIDQCVCWSTCSTGYLGYLGASHTCEGGKSFGSGKKSTAECGGFGGINHRIQCILPLSK